MEKYQLGTVNKNSTEQTVVIVLSEKTFDFLEILHEPEVNSLLQKEKLEKPHSLMDIVHKWEQWDVAIPKLINDIANGKYNKFLLNEQDLMWLSPITNPGKIICIGINYKDHIEEMGLKSLPTRPYSFFKPTTSISGHGASVKIPSKVEKADWEAELGVIIGKSAYNVKGEAALNCIAGYTVMNDLSARDWVNEPSVVGFDWVLAKAYDGFLPTGPVMTPKKFIADPQNLDISLKLNGETQQDSNTSNMFFSVQQIIEHLSSITTLEPGDLIATGTPSGVSQGKKEKRYLKSGDIMEVSVKGIGKLTTKMD